MQQSTLARIALALILAFTLVACSALTGTGNPNVAATVNGTEIPVSAVEEQFEQAKAQPQVAQQLEADEDGSYRDEVQAQIVSQLVFAELLDQWAADLDIEVTDADIEQERESIVEQLGGQDAFDQAVEQSGLSEDQVEQQLRQSVLQRKISETVTGDVDVSEADIEQFYEENAETRFGASATARHILVEDRAKAQRILRQLQEGADFAELAQQESTDPGSAEQGGELPPFGRGQMVPPFEEAVFSAQPGDLVGPVQTEFGFHVIEVVDVTENQPLDDVRDEIRSELEEAQQNELLQEQLGERTSAADVTVNPRFGTWNGETGQVEPQSPLGETSEDAQPQATDGLPGGTEVPGAPVEAPTG